MTDTMQAAAEGATMKGPNWETILGLAATRQNSSSPLISQMMEIKDRYNGDIVYPWAEALTAGADMPDLTPHLVGESIDNYGLRAASVPMDILCPPVHSHLEVGTGSRNWAGIRRHSLAATLHKNRWPLITRKFYRHLAGYSTASLMVVPNFKTQMPQIKVLNPLNVFPDPQSAEDFQVPTNCVYIQGYSGDTLRKMFPHLATERGGPIPAVSYDNQLWDIITYIDEDVHVFGLGGQRTQWDSNVLEYGQYSVSQELSRIENRIGMFPGITMARVTLDRMGSALAHVMGQLDWASRLQLLDIVATEKAIYPDTYVLGDSSRVPVLHTADGRWKDGRTGEVNMITDAAAIGQLRSTPDPSGKQSIDRMERNFRVSTGLAAQFGGETSNAMRSGRGVDAQIGASVDPRVEEMQETAVSWMPHIADAIFSCWEAYWPDKERTLYSGYSGAKGHVKFTPGRHFSESHEAAFTYPIAGADIQLTNIVLSQQLAAEAISLETFRYQHPWIQDPEGEARRVGEESMEKIGFQAMAQKAMGGEIPLEQLAMIQEEFAKNDNGDIFTAILAAAARLQEQQAAAAPPPPDDPAMAMDPSMAPGLGGPTGPAGPPAGPPPEIGAQIGPTQGMEGLRELQNALAAGGRAVNGVVGPQ